MNKEWREFVNNRCMCALYENIEFSEKEKNAIEYTKLNTEARELCYILGLRDANELFCQQLKIPSQEDVRNECESILKKDRIYCNMLCQNEDVDLLQERAEAICYEAGFKNAIARLNTCVIN